MKWTSHDLEIVRQHYSSGKQDLAELSKSMGRTVASIKCKACSMGVVASVALLEKDYEYIKSLPGIRSIRDVARDMGRSWNTVKKIIMDLGIQDRYSPPNSLWNPTDEEKSLMNTNMTLKQLSMKLGRSEATILKKIRQLNLNPRVKKKKEPKPPKIKKEVKPMVIRRDSGTDRIREAMERINRI